MGLMDASPWHLSHRSDDEARPFADRHYNRQKIGAKGFAPPGRAMVLKRSDGFWITSYPLAQYVKHAWAGAWVCSAFRNEGVDLSSDLICWAVSATRWYYGAPPEIGMITFVDPKKTRRKRDPGRCFIKAGFRRVGYTKGGLVALLLSPADMPYPIPAVGMFDRHKDYSAEVVEMEVSPWD
jgi:hypothetical protein